MVHDNFLDYNYTLLLTSHYLLVVLELADDTGTLLAPVVCCIIHGCLGISNNFILAD